MIWTDTYRYQYWYFGPPLILSQPDQKIGIQLCKVVNKSNCRAILWFQSNCYINLSCFFFFSIPIWSSFIPSSNLAAWSFFLNASSKWWSFFSDKALLHSSLASYALEEGGGQINSQYTQCILRIIHSVYWELLYNCFY